MRVHIEVTSEDTHVAVDTEDRIRAMSEPLMRRDVIIDAVNQVLRALKMQEVV